MTTKQEYKAIIKIVEKNSKYIAKIIFKDIDGDIPIGIVVPKYRDQQDEALEEAERWFTDPKLDAELELWPADLIVDDPDPDEG